MSLLDKPKVSKTLFILAEKFENLAFSGNRVNSDEALKRKDELLRQMEW